MAFRAVCPECGATVSVNDDQAKSSVRCHQCGSPVALPAAKATAPPPLPKKQPAAEFEVLDDDDDDDIDENGRPRVGTHDKDDDDDRPRRSRRAADDDDDEQPRRRTARYDDDDDNEDIESPRRSAERHLDDDEDDDEEVQPRRRSNARSDDEDDNDEVESPRRTARRHVDDDEDAGEEEQPRRRSIARSDDEDFEEDDEDDEDDAPRRTAARVQDDEDEDEEEESPRRAAARVQDDEDEDEDEDEEEESPRRTAARSDSRDQDDDDVDEDDDLGHRSSRHSRDAVDDDDSIPRRQPGDVRPARKSGRGLLVALAIVGVIVLGGAGGAVGYYLWPKDDGEQVASNDDNQTPGPFIPPIKRDPVDTNPKIPDPKVPNPKLPPLAVLPITLANFEGEQKIIRLPGKATDICAGGDGRYLFVHCADEKKLLVYDVSAANIVKEIETTGNDTRIAAGATKLLLADNTNRLLRRFDLFTFTQDGSGTFPFPGKLDDLSLGSGSHGPALAIATEPANAWPGHFVNVETLGKADVGWGTAPAADLPRRARFRAAANGSRWAGIPSDGDARGVVIVTREGKRITAAFQEPQKQLGFAALSTDGQTLCSRHGISPVGEAITRPSLPETTSFSVPALTGPLFVHQLRVKSKAGELGQRAVVSTRETAGTSSGPRVQIQRPYESGGPMPADRHIWYSPEAGTLIVCPGSGGNRLEIIKLDVLKGSPVAPSLITSTPPDSFRPGQVLRYQVRAFTTAPKLSYAVVDFPQATIDDAGVLTWRVPPSEQRDRVTFSIRASSVSQTLNLFNAAAPAPVTPAPQPKDPKTPDPKDPKSPDPKIPTVGNVAPGAKLVQDAGGRLPITPPAMTAARQEIALPSPMRDACVAGGGRFLIFYCPTARKLVVLDVATLKTDKTITVNADEILFAGGMDRLMLIYPNEKVILRYSLATFKNLDDVSLDIRQTPIAAAMGSGVAGPLILGGVPSQLNASKMSLAFFDPDTLKEVRIDKADGDFGVSFGTAARLRVSANGRTVTAWRTQLFPSGLQVARLDGNNINGSYKAESVGHVTAGPDGQTIFTEKGMFNAKGEPIGRREAAVPAVHGSMFVTVAPGPKGPDGPSRVSVWQDDKGPPLIEFDDLPGFDGKRDPFERDNPHLALDRRFFLIPEAKILIVVTPAANKLIVCQLPDAKK